MKMRYLLVLIGLPSLVLAGLPRAPCVFFGMLKDAYGQPYLQGARITFQGNAVEAAYQNIDGLVGYGINFEVSVEMDSGSGERYEPYAMREGEQLDVVVEVDGVVQPILEASSLTVPAPGTDVALSLTTGTDSDGDGLPDEWEQQLMAASGGAFTNIDQIVGSDDFDGDGASNMHEYLSGTFAFLDYDSFSIEDLEQAADGRFIFRFLSVHGKSYGVDVTDGLTSSNEWVVGLFSLEEAEPSNLMEIVGDGYYRTMYVEQGGTQQFMRLQVR